LATKNVQIYLSDVSGEEIKGSDRVQVTVRNHPKLEEDKRFDAHLDEMKDIKTVPNLVTLEMSYPDEPPKKIYVTVAELEKLIPTDKMEAFDGTKGRRTGFSPRSSM
jgi:hypothetical protein